MTGSALSFVALHSVVDTDVLELRTLEAKRLRSNIARERDKAFAAISQLDVPHEEVLYYKCIFSLATPLTLSTLHSLNAALSALLSKRRALTAAAALYISARSFLQQAIDSLVNPVFPLQPNASLFRTLKSRTWHALRHYQCAATSLLEALFSWRSCLTKDYDFMYKGEAYPATLLSDVADVFRSPVTSYFPLKREHPLFYNIFPADAQPEVPVCDLILRGTVKVRRPLAHLRNKSKNNEVYVTWLGHKNGDADSVFWSEQYLQQEPLRSLGTLYEIYALFTVGYFLPCIRWDLHPLRLAKVPQHMLQKLRDNAYRKLKKAAGPPKLTKLERQILHSKVQDRCGPSVPLQVLRDTSFKVALLVRLTVRRRLAPCWEALWRKRSERCRKQRVFECLKSITTRRVLCLYKQKLKRYSQRTNLAFAIRDIATRIQNTVTHTILRYYFPKLSKYAARAAEVRRQTAIGEFRAQQYTIALRKCYFSKLKMWEPLSKNVKYLKRVTEMELVYKYWMILALWPSSYQCLLQKRTKEKLRKMEVTLDAGCELRYEVFANDKSAKLKLVSERNQFAEINGTEMAAGKMYDLSASSNGSVFTWHGCQLMLQHIPSEQVYTAKAPVMQRYAHVHSMLEKRRQYAKESSTAGPRVLICGSSSSGKLSLAKILVNYAARLDWQLTYADLDVTHNSISIPGTLSAVPIDRPVPFDEGFSMFPPINMYYGSVTVEDKGEDLYYQLISQLSQYVEQRHTRNTKANQGGLIVKGMNLNSVKDIQHIIKAFKIDVVLVVDDDKLHAQLANSSTGISEVEVMSLPRSGGCCMKTEARRETERSQSLNIYFNGWQHMKLYPHSYEIPDVSKINLVKMGGSLATTMDGLLPIGEKSTLAATDVSVVQASKELQNTIIALSQATVIDEAASAPVYGFALVQSVSDDCRSITLLIPVPVTSLISDIFVVGDVRWLGH